MIRTIVLSAFLLFYLTAQAESPYHWYTFNIPPFGSVSGQGIGYELANAYIEAGFENKIILATPARWHRDMLDTQKNNFCSTGSWKLPNTPHRLYSDSILNTVDYGVAVRPELYKKLSNNGKNRVVSIVDVIDATKESGQLLILKDRPVFGLMGAMIERGRLDKGTQIKHQSAAKGPVSLLKMADIENRHVDSVLIFPEEFPVFTQENPDHNLQYMMLSEGTNFAPIRASCPDTKIGRIIISEINNLLDKGLRDKVFKLFLDALPDIPEIKQQARHNQHCIKDNSCKDPLI